MQKITKAVIPCGGRGTRFLPVTKALAKEMLPIVDTPVLAYIVDEFINSGITSVCIVLAPGKESIKKYFTQNVELEKLLLSDGREDLYKLICNIHNRAEIVFASQPKPRGSGDAVYRAKDFAGGEPFCMATGDDLMISNPPVTKQLIDAYNETDAPIIGVQKVKPEQTSMYGVINPHRTNGRFIKCAGIVEKPKSAPPSNYAAMGRYLLTPDIFAAIDKTEPDKKGEYQLTDAIKLLMAQRDVYAYDFIGKRYDMGDKFGSLQATVELSLNNPVYGAQFKVYLKELVKTLG